MRYILSNCALRQSRTFREFNSPHIQSRRSTRQREMRDIPIINDFSFAFSIISIRQEVQTGIMALTVPLAFFGFAVVILYHYTGFGNGATYRHVQIWDVRHSGLGLQDIGRS